MIAPLVEVWADPHDTSGPGVDISGYIDTVSLRHGRDDTDTQPDSATATFELSWDTDLAYLPPAVEVGSPVQVTVYSADDAPHVRFLGYLTDITAGWDDAGPDTPSMPVAQLIAAGPMSNLGRRVVGDEPWPAELDGARMARIAGLAGMPLDPATSDPGTVTILGRDVDAQPALDLMQAVASDAVGMVWETRLGELRYADAEHRRGVAPSLTLDSGDVLVTPEWRRSTDGLINDVSIGYGTEPIDGGDQPRYRASNAKSIDRFGEYAVSVATELAELADATALANLWLARNSSPVWVMTQLPLDLGGLDDDRRAVALDLEQSDLVRLVGMPVVSSAPTTTDLWLEGWSEVISSATHDLTLAVSGYCRTAPAPRWNDIPSSWTWDTGNGSDAWPALSWDDATCVGPVPSQGRWDDTPSSVRWDTITPADTTWNTWKG